MMKKKWMICFALIFSLMLIGCSNGEGPTDTISEQTENLELDRQLHYIYQLALDSDDFDGTYEEWLESVRGPQGEDGRDVIFRVSDSYIQWQYVGEQTWINLLDLDQFTGDSLYQSYIEKHPDYTGDESQWLDDLIYGRLAPTEKHLVQFHSNGGLEVASYYVDHGASIDLVIPSREGYTFLGWFTGHRANDGQFTVLSRVESDLDLYARWQANEDTVLKDDGFQYYVAGHFNGWEEALDYPNYQMKARSLNDPDLLDIRYKLDDAMLLYSLDINIPNAVSGFSITYHIGGNDVRFDKNLTLKLAQTETIDGQERLSMWGPSPESGRIHNLTPETLFIPSYVDPSSSDYVFGQGDWNSDPVLYQAGHYTIVFAEMNGERYLGAIKQSEHTYPDQATYVSGLYNYRFQSLEVRQAFMAAAERYLLQSMAAGIPLYVDEDYRLHDRRLVLPLDLYMPIVGFGAKFGWMTEDDSNVLMADGLAGNVGDYTFRTLSNSSPMVWNQWLYDVTTDADFMSLYYDAPYTYTLNDDQTGFELSPSMMASDPIAKDAFVNAYGQKMATKWRFVVKDDLEWFYHPDTDISQISDHHIDAHDFVDTYKLVLKENWFRAISGGGDFVTSASMIEGTDTYSQDPSEANWENVGIKLINDHMFEFTFVDAQTEWQVKTFMSSFTMSPVHTELYEFLGDIKNGGSFGTSHTHIAYSGPFYVDSYEEDVLLTYKENPNFHDPDLYFYTGYEIQIISDQSLGIQAFEDGSLDTVALTNETADTYKDHPGLKAIPNPTTYRIMINGLGDTDRQKAQFPGSTYEPEPLLADLDFKRAMYFVIDRQRLATELIDGARPQMYLFSDAYMVDVEDGRPYRQTDAGLSVGQGLYMDTQGYHLETALAYWQKALDRLVDQGIYEENDVIQLDFYMFSGSDKQAIVAQYIKDQFEEIFSDASNPYGISIQVHVESKDFPDIYYDYLMQGEFDLAIGGLSASILDAGSFLDVYSDDNRAGFQFNWGIDTSSANIDVKYMTYDYNQDGDIIKRNYHHEMWSYNAIASVLNGEILMQEGREAVLPQTVFLQVLPTSFTFAIYGFDNPVFKNLSYSVYQSQGSSYQILNDLEDIPVSSETVTVTGSKPYPNTIRVVVQYELLDGYKERDYTLTSWSYAGKLVDSVITTDTSATIRLVTEDLVRVFEPNTIFVYLDSDDSLVTDLEINYQGSTIEITGLSPETKYYLIFQTSDGFTDPWIVDYGLKQDFITGPVPE